MTKTPILAIAAIVLVAGAAFAQEADPAIDVNGDGFYSFPELSAAYPELDAETFSEMDTTGDGLLDMAELTAGQEAGIMPMDDSEG